MEFLKIIGKIVLFLVGGLFLASGLFCGAIGFSSASNWGIGVIGLAFAALGGFLVALPFGFVGKTRQAERSEMAESISAKSGQQDDGERTQP